MSKFKEDDQAGNDVMQAFWKSPIGQKWLKQAQEEWDELKEEKAKAVGMLLPVENAIMRIEFKNKKE